MAYYIFLKFLRCLEEFRKNPHVKIPPKSSSTIFQSLAKFKNQILIRKFFFFPFFAFGPADLAARQASSAQPATSFPPPSPALACRPAQATHLPGPTRPSRSPVPYLQPRPAPPPFRSCAAAPPPPGLPWPPFLPARATPPSFTPWPLLPPSNRALTRRDEPEFTRPLNATSSPAVTRPHRLGAPPQAL
jgi:hypothetical protein